MGPSLFRGDTANRSSSRLALRRARRRRNEHQRLDVAESIQDLVRSGRPVDPSRSSIRDPHGGHVTPAANCPSPGCRRRAGPRFLTAVRVRLTTVDTRDIQGVLSAPMPDSQPEEIGGGRHLTRAALSPPRRASGSDATQGAIEGWRARLERELFSGMQLESGGVCGRHRGDERRSNERDEQAERQHATPATALDHASAPAAALRQFSLSDIKVVEPAGHAGFCVNSSSDLLKPGLTLRKHCAKVRRDPRRFGLARTFRGLEHDEVVRVPNSTAHSVTPRVRFRW